MLSRLKKLVPQHFVLRLWYHKIMGYIAAWRYGFPGRKLKHVIGVTGTDGKTTTCYLTAQILERTGKKVGLATTVGFWIGEKKWQNKTHKTTMGRFGLQKLLRDMVDADVDVAVLEVSSHGLVQSRLSEIDFNTVVITNLSREHLDYHGTMKAYRNAKGLLFKRAAASKKNRTQIVYADFDEAPYYIGFAADHKYTYGTGDISGAVPMHLTTLEEQKVGQKCTLSLEGREFQTSTSLSGSFNIQNIMAALLASKAAGVPLEQGIGEVPHLVGVPGRMEEIPNTLDRRIFIDYAVTPDALKTLYTSLLDMAGDRHVIAVLGACGDRDQGKRPQMGAIATSMCHQVFFTNEEPYSERPSDIVAMLVEGAKNQGSNNYTIVLDRARAITQAIMASDHGDIIVISGMGDQTSMIVGDQKLPWSDREEVKKAIERLADSLS